MAFELLVPATSPLAGVIIGLLVPDETLWYQFWFVLFASIGFVAAALFSSTFLSLSWFLALALALACSFSVARSHLWAFVLTFSGLVLLSSPLSEQLLILAALAAGGMLISVNGWRSLWPLLLVPMIILASLLLF